MGPGHGEAIVVHLGQGEWLVVDSCTSAWDGTAQPAPLKYLRALGVPVASAVKLIVASHWDSDHIQGIATVLESCPGAEFCCSTTFTRREFTNFVSSMSLGATATDGANVSDFHRVLQILRSRGEPIIAATPGRKLFKKPIITSWSPSDFEEELFLNFVAQQHPKAGEPYRRAVPGSPNLTSVVIGIDWDDASVLLGADMESHPDVRRGWGAVVSRAKYIGFVRCGMVKVPHHGSHTGHDELMWTELLNGRPISVIAPFGKGPPQSRPPKPADVRRINGLSSSTFITARRSTTKPMAKMSVSVRRSLREGMIRIYDSNTPLGIVRLRRKHGEKWKHELFGGAVQAK